MKTVCGKEISCVVLRPPPYQHVWLSGKIDYLRRPSHNWLQIHEIRGMVSFFNIRLGSSRNKKGDNRLFRKSIINICTFVHVWNNYETMKVGEAEVGTWWSGGWEHFLRNWISFWQRSHPIHSDFVFGTLMRGDFFKAHMHVLSWWKPFENAGAERLRLVKDSLDWSPINFDSP